MQEEDPDFRVSTLADIEALQRTSVKTLSAQIKFYRSKHAGKRFM